MGTTIVMLALKRGGFRCIIKRSIHFNSASTTSVLGSRRSAAVMISISEPTRNVAPIPKKCPIGNRKKKKRKFSKKMSPAGYSLTYFLTFTYLSRRQWHPHLRHRRRQKRCGCAHSSRRRKLCAECKWQRGLYPIRRAAWPPAHTKPESN